MVVLAITELVIISILIIIIGIVANIAGFGGAIFAIPLLSIVFKIPLKTVIGSTLAAIAIPAFIGFIFAWRRNEVDLSAGIVLEIPTIIGAVLGASLVRLIDDMIIGAIFGVIAVLVSTLMFRQNIAGKSSENEGRAPSYLERLSRLRPWYYIEKDGYSYRLSIPLMILAGLFIGILSGLLGVGGGWLKTPLLIYAIGLPPIIASGTALFMLVLTSISGGITHYLAGNWDQNLFIVLAVSLSLGAVIGDYIKQQLRSKYITVVISVSLFFIGLIMIFQPLISK